MAVKRVVELVGVKHSYGDRVVLDGVDVRVGVGQSVGIAGRSGSGKSTLARLLTLHADPQVGERLVEGRHFERPTWQDRQAVRRGLQLVFQDPANSFVHQWKVREILREAGCDAPEEILDRVKLPLEVLERGPLELSGGEKRRLAIARALAVAPKMLVLDETLSGQDGLLRMELCAVLREAQVREKMALVVVSHDVRLLEKMCGEVVVLEGGKVAGGLDSAEGQRLSAAAFWGPDRT